MAEGKPYLKIPGAGVDKKARSGILKAQHVILGL